MKKRAFFSAAAAAALLMANPVVNKAAAASNYSASEQGKVYVYQTSNFDINEINSYLQKFMQDHGINWDITQTGQNAPTSHPVQQTNKPAGVQKPAPAPVQKPTVQKSVNTPQQKPAASAYQLSAFEQKVVELTNQERAKNGVPPLKIDSKLSKMARDKSRDMQTSHYFDHTSPTYGSPFDMMKKYGITYNYAGENIAMGQRSPEEVVNAWMNSEGHRKNILNSNYNYIGVGYVAEGNYWTQEFIGK